MIPALSCRSSCPAVLLTAALLAALTACAHEPAMPPPAAGGEVRAADSREEKTLAAKAVVAEPPSGPAHQTFHYKTDSVPGILGQWGQGKLDPQTADNFAAGVRYHCPGPGTLHLESEAEPDGSQLRIAIYTTGTQELALTRKLEPLDAKIEEAGPCFVVVKVQDFSWECTFRIKATFTPEKLRP